MSAGLTAERRRAREGLVLPTHVRGRSPLLSAPIGAQPQRDEGAIAANLRVLDRCFREPRIKD